jgi:hypothetical protein
VAFGKFDTDGSGELDKKEFAQACKLLGLKLGKQEMRLVFSSLDSTGDYTISADEFMQRMRKVKRDRIASGGGATRASLTSANTGALNSLAKAKAALPSEAQASPRPSPRRRGSGTQLEVSKPSGLLAGVLGAEPTAPKPPRAQTKASAAPLPDYVEDAEGGLTLSAADDGGGGQKRKRGDTMEEQRRDGRAQQRRVPPFDQPLCRLCRLCREY